MSREYGSKRPGKGFSLGVGYRYLITIVVAAVAFLVPRLLHDRTMVGVAELVLWASFIGWVALSPRQRNS